MSFHIQHDDLFEQIKFSIQEILFDSGNINSLNYELIKNFSSSLCLMQVKVWFQNRRTKHKRTQQEDGDEKSGNKSTGSPKNFDSDDGELMDDEIDIEDDDNDDNEEDNMA